MRGVVIVSLTESSRRRLVREVICERGRGTDSNSRKRERKPAYEMFIGMLIDRTV